MELSVPCYRCGARQTDPVGGASPWRRGVRANEQVLVCPDCQQNSAWLDDLDRCPVCGSTALFRRLGATVCRDCEAGRLGAAARTAIAGRVPAAGIGTRGTAIAGTSAAGTATGGTAAAGERARHSREATLEPASGREAAPGRDGTPDEPRAAAVDLAREVAAAIDRVLGRA